MKLTSVLRNLRCWIYFCPPTFPHWLLPADRVEIDGRQFVYRGWPKRFPNEETIRDYFNDARRAKEGSDRPKTFARR